MSEKKEWVLKAFKGEKVDRVPVGFWHHFTSEDEWLHGFSNPVIIEKNIEGHKRFIREVQPDFIKLMSDGYFAYPNPAIAKDKSLQELATIQPLGPDHAWIKEQVDLVKKIKQEFTLSRKVVRFSRDVRFLEDLKMARQACCILVARMPFRLRQRN